MFVKILLLAMLTLAASGYAAFGVVTGVWPRLSNDCPESQNDDLVPCSAAIVNKATLPDLAPAIREVFTVGVDNLEMVRLTGEAELSEEGKVCLLYTSPSPRDS